MKRFVIATIATMMISIPVFGANKGIDIQVDGKIKYNSETPVVLDDMTLVSMEGIFKALNAEVIYNEENEEYIVNFEGKEIIFYADSTEVLINEIKKFMPISSTKLNGTLMVPLRFVSEVIGVNVDWNKNSNKLIIETKDSKGKEAESQEENVMTYEEALKKALSSNSNLKNLEESFELLEEKRKDLSRSFADVNTQGQYVHVASVIRGVNTYQNQIKNTSLNEKIMKDATEYMLRSYITTIEGYKLDIQLMEEKIKLEQRDIKNLKLKNELGLASQSDLTTAEQNLERSKSNLQSLKIALNREKVALKSFLDINEKEEIKIEFDATVKELNVTDINGYAFSKISSAPNIEILDNAIDNAEYNLATHSGDLSETRLEVENALSKAKRDKQDAEKNMEQSIKQAYNNIQTLLENKKVLELDLIKAKEDEEKMLANFEAGLVTLNDVENIRLAILSSEMAIKKNELNYYNLIFPFEKPYLLSQ